jgi:hypothetical protein
VVSRDTRTVSLRIDRLEHEWRIVDVSVSPASDAAESKEGVAPLKLPTAE